MICVCGHDELQHLDPIKGVQHSPFLKVDRSAESKRYCFAENECPCLSFMKDVKANGIESNGPANIVQLIDTWRQSGPDRIGEPEISVLRKLAWRSVLYMRQLEGTSKEDWGGFNRRLDTEEKNAVQSV